MKRKRNSRSLVKIETANRRKEKRSKSGKKFPGKRTHCFCSEMDSLMKTSLANPKKRYTFDDLYRVYKDTKRGLNPQPRFRGKENPLLGAMYSPSKYPLIVLAMAHITSLNDSFKNLKGVNISHWVRKYC